MAEDNDEFDERLEALNEAGMAGDWDKAVKLGEALRAEFPDSFSDNKRVVEYLAIAYCLAEAYYKRGSSYNELKQYERAIKDFDKAIALKSDYIEAYFNRGVNYVELGQYERAIKDFDKAIKLKPDYASAYNNRGVSYNGLELYEHAIADYDKAIELDPEHAAAYHNRGASYLRLELYERIRTDYDKAIDMARTAEIDERIQRRRKTSRKRLRSLRKYKGVLFVLLIIAAPFLWLYVSEKIW